MKRLAVLLLVLVFICGAVSAEDSLWIDLDRSAGSASFTAGQGIRITRTISASPEFAENVRLTLRTDRGTMLLDKDYGYVGGLFDSGVLYVNPQGASSCELVLQVGNASYSIRISCSYVENGPSDSSDFGGWMD